MAHIAWAKPEAHVHLCVCKKKCTEEISVSYLMHAIRPIMCAPC